MVVQKMKGKRSKLCELKRDNYNKKHKDLYEYSRNEYLNKNTFEPGRSNYIAPYFDVFSYFSSLQEALILQGPMLSLADRALLTLI